MTSEEVLRAVKWRTLKICNTRILALIYTAFYDTASLDIQDIFQKYQSKYNLRRQNRFALPKPNTNFLMKSVKYIGTKQWNSLPHDLRTKESPAAFKKGLFENVNFINWFSIFLRECQFCKLIWYFVHDHISYSAKLIVSK